MVSTLGLAVSLQTLAAKVQCCSPETTWKGLEWSSAIEHLPCVAGSRVPLHTMHTTVSVSDQDRRHIWMRKTQRDLAAMWSVSSKSHMLDAVRSEAMGYAIEQDPEALMFFPPSFSAVKE